MTVQRLNNLFWCIWLLIEKKTSPGPSHFLVGNLFSRFTYLPVAQKRRSLDEHKRCVKARHCGEFHAMAGGNNIARTVSRKSGLVKSKSAKMRGRSVPSKTGVAEGAIRKTAKQTGALTSARIAAAPSAKKAGSSKSPAKDTSDSEQEDKDWAASDGEQMEVVPDDPPVTRKSRTSMPDATIELVTKTFEIRRENIACPKEDCGATGTLSHNGMNHVGPMAKCTKCTRKTSGWKLAGLCGITPDSETVEEPAPEDPIATLKAANQALRKANAEQAKQIEALQATNSRILNEMSGLRAQIAKLIATLNKGDGPVEEEDAPVNAPNEPEAMHTAEEEPQQATAQASEPIDETRAPSFAEAVRKNLRVSQLGPLAQEKFAQLRSIASSYAPTPRTPRAHNSSVTPLYFRARRGPIGQLRRALREHLPGSALLNLCFIGQGTLEILCSEAHKEKLIYVMNKARMSHIKGSSVLFPHAYSKRDIPVGQKKNHCSLAIERAKRLSTTLKDGTAKTFYTELVQKLQSTLESLSNSAESSAPEQVLLQPSTGDDTPRAQSS